MCRRTEEEVGPKVGLPHHRHFVWFFNVPVLAPTRDQPLYLVIPTHRPIKSHFTITLGTRRTHSRLTPRALTGVKVKELSLQGYRFVNLESLQTYVTDITMHVCQCPEAINLSTQGRAPIKLNSEITSYKSVSVLRTRVHDTLLLSAQYRL